MTLTEEQAQEIRKSGISVVQFKSIAKKVCHFFTYTFPELINKVVKAFEFTVQVILEFLMIWGLQSKLSVAHTIILHLADINL